ELMVPRGSYYLVAFADANGDFARQADEPAGQHSSRPLPVDSGGGVVTELNIVIGSNDPQELDLPIGTAVVSPRPDRRPFTSPGIILPLDDPLFAEENGSKGFWQPVEFFREFGGNIIFLGPYDPAKIPLLFVHGATGTPAGWQYLLDHLDLNRFQPWFYYYPSGASIKSMADLLFWKMINLQSRYQVPELHIIAHSMGGLVARSFLVDYGQFFPSIKKFITISTPWGGDALSDYGVTYSPGVIPVWKDMGPDSEFARSIYRRKLPETIEPYLFFSYKGNRNPLRPNNDGVITLATQLDQRAQAEAKMVAGFDEDHSSILTSSACAALVNTVLSSGPADAVDPPEATGMLQVRFSGAAQASDPELWPSLFLEPLAPGEPGSIYLRLGPADDGRVLGPFPAGDYRVVLVADAHRAVPGEYRIRLGSEKTVEVSFQLIPRGTVSGLITTKFYEDGDPAGVYLPFEEKLTIRSITLTGLEGQRTLSPGSCDNLDIFSSYQQGKDWACGNAFAFYDVAPGSHILAVEADGFELYRKSREVVPGRANPYQAIELQPLK
ncbi:MAG: alpha/beta hydrolase, partial [Desulfofustis sp.]|nr:alpha/beta hydrolase [Desulfofustis sp.]